MRLSVQAFVVFCIALVHPTKQLTAGLHRPPVSSSLLAACTWRSSRSSLQSKFFNLAPGMQNKAGSQSKHCTWRSDAAEEMGLTGTDKPLTRAAASDIPVPLVHHQIVPTDTAQRVYVLHGHLVGSDDNRRFLVCFAYESNSEQGFPINILEARHFQAGGQHCQRCGAPPRGSTKKHLTG